MNKLLSIILFSLALSSSPNSYAESRSATSGPFKNALLELYTSEGCSSCPPAEAWLSSITDARQPASNRLIPLAFYVDYWDYLGWKDPFANPDYSMRQKMHQINGAIRNLYTPQLILNASELRPKKLLDEKLDVLRQTPALVELSLALVSEQNEDKEKIWGVQVTSSPVSGVIAARQSLYIAVTENNIESKILAGENRGRTLIHDHVVRKLIGPIELSLAGGKTISENIKLPENWNEENLNLVSFIQSKRGEILQAVSLTPGRTDN